MPAVNVNKQQRNNYIFSVLIFCRKTLPVTKIQVPRTFIDLGNLVVSSLSLLIVLHTILSTSNFYFECKKLPLKYCLSVLKGLVWILARSPSGMQISVKSRFRKRALSPGIIIGSNQNIPYYVFDNENCFRSKLDNTGAKY